MAEIQRDKRIFTMDRISHQSLGILSKKTGRTMSEIVCDAVGLLDRLMFCAKCSIDLQFDHRLDNEIYEAVLEGFNYGNDPKTLQEFEEDLKKIKEKAKEKHE